MSKSITEFACLLEVFQNVIGLMFIWLMLTQCEHLLDMGIDDVLLRTSLALYSTVAE